MARFSGNDFEKFNTSTKQGASYFALKNDKDVSAVRFLYNSAEDVKGYTVHEIELNGKKRYVDCLREAGDPVDDCPFCKARKHLIPKTFVKLYNVDEDKVQIWERGRQFYSQLTSTLARYDREPIVSQVFEIERNGKAGDQRTTYGIFRLDNEYPVDDTKLEDFDVPTIVGGLVLKKSAEDMEYYLENNCFPSDEQPTRRTERNDDRPRRRTPREDDEF